MVLGLLNFDSETWQHSRVSGEEDEANLMTWVVTLFIFGGGLLGTDVETFLAVVHTRASRGEEEQGDYRN